MSDMNKPDPLSNEQIDKIFGMKNPDFTEEGDMKVDGNDEMVECCHYHFLQWLMDAVKVGRSFNERDTEHALHHLKGIAATIYQAQDDEEGTPDPMVETLKQVAPGLANLLQGVMDPKNMVSMEGTTESGFVFQAVPDGIRLINGGKSMRIRPMDAVLMAATIGGWVWDNPNMRKVFAERMKDTQKEYKQATQGNDESDN